MCGSFFFFFFFFFSEIIVQYNFFFCCWRSLLADWSWRSLLADWSWRPLLADFFFLVVFLLALAARWIFFFWLFFCWRSLLAEFFFFCWRSLLADRSLRSLLADFLLFFFLLALAACCSMTFFFLFLYTISVPRGTQHSVFLRSAVFVWHQCNFGSENGFLAVKLKNFSKASCLKHSLSVSCVANRHCLL